MSSELHVIFGTGPVGLSVMDELVKRGKQVRMVNRRGTANVPAGVEVVKGDAYDVNSTRELTKGAAVVYQCAQPEYHEWVTKFMPLQTGILEGAAANGAKLIVTENLYMYGEPNGKPLTEDLPNNARTRKGKIRAQMSEAILAAHGSGKIRAAMARGSDFYGPREPISGDQFFYPALEGKSVSGFGNLDMPHTMTYIPDFGKTLVAIGERDDALGQIWHVPSPDAPTQRQFITMIFEEIGKPPKISAINKLMMRLAGLFIKPAGEMVEMMYEFEKPFVMDSSKAQRTLAIQPTPIRQAIKDSVDYFRTHPKVAH